MAYPLLIAQMVRNTETLLAAKQQILNLETARCSLERLGLTHPHPVHPTQWQCYITEVVSWLGATLPTVHYSSEMINWVPTVSDAVNIDEWRVSCGRHWWVRTGEGNCTASHPPSLSGEEHHGIQLMAHTHTHKLTGGSKGHRNAA